MSAPTSGSSGSTPSASPVPGYYPDPSIPNYIRYWDGSAWVPGTSRPAPSDGAVPPAPPALAPPSPASQRPDAAGGAEPDRGGPVGGQAGAAGVPAQPGAGQGARGRSVEESGPVFLDEDPHAPRAQPGPAGVPAQPGAGQGGRGRSVEESGPMFLDEDPHAPRAQTGPSVGAARGSGDAPEWPRMDRPGTELPRISWGTDASRAPAAGQQAGAGGPALPAQAQPPASDAAFRSLPAQAGPGGSHTGTPSPGPQGPGLQPPRAAAPGAAVPGQAVPDRAEPAFRAPQAEGQGAGWAAQVQGLAREGGEVPWRPVASDPFGASRGHDRPGGLVRRFAARVIDGVVLGALTAAAAVPLGAAAYHHARDKVDQAKLTGETVRVWLLDGTTGAELGAVAVVFLLAGLLLEVLPTARWGRTLGKKLVGLRVLDIEAQLPPGFGASLRRWLARTVLNAVVVGVVGAAWCLFDRPWKQCWHDKAARTFVAEV